MNGFDNGPTADEMAMLDQGYTQAVEKEVVPENLAPARDQLREETPTPEESDNNPVKVQSSEPDVYKVNDVDYSLDDIAEALEARSNKDKWQKTFTERDQQFAEHRKNLNNELEKWQTVQQDETLMNGLKELLPEDHPLFKDDLSKTLNSFETQNTDITQPEEITESPNSDLEALRNEIEIMKAEKELDSEIQSLVSKYPTLDDDALNEVMTIATEKGIENLEDAFKIARFDTAENSAITKALNAFEEAQKMKTIPEADGQQSGEREVPTPKLNDQSDLRDYVLNEYSESLYK
tara:strand:- start:1383 stop:2261 length:879 start_codon:yes stop_codon:yes gene_type:complete